MTSEYFASSTTYFADFMDALAGTGKNKSEAQRRADLDFD